MEQESVWEAFRISPEVAAYGEKVLSSLRTRFDAVDETAEYNSCKVIRAMQEAQVSEACLLGTTGYGYNDVGRETLEQVYARVFHTEDALVRPQIVSGTHALAVTLSGMLRPGDVLLSASGKPYDTLEKVIGIRPAEGSLAEYGVSYREVPLSPDGTMDTAAVRRALEEDSDHRIRLVAIQRSRGYQTRPSFSVDAIGVLIRAIKEVRPDLPVMTDNCYGEFVERTEPSDVGSDLIVGSLIKNPGGGIAPCGGYIAGKKDLIERISYRLTGPGLGKEVGASLHALPAFYQGLFFAPTVTAAAVKGAIFAAKLYEGFGFEAYPGGDEDRHDIIQAITFHRPDAVQAFCEGIQAAAPVDSFVRPEPAPMPGYTDPVIMAAGAFVSGSSIELSADAPMREPYTVFFQGGLTFAHAKLGILKTVQKMTEYGIFDPKTIQ